MHVSPEDPPQLGDRFQPSNSLMDVRKCESEPLMPNCTKVRFSLNYVRWFIIDHSWLSRSLYIISQSIDRHDSYKNLGDYIWCTPFHFYGCWRQNLQNFVPSASASAEGLIFENENFGFGQKYGFYHTLHDTHSMILVLYFPHLWKFWVCFDLNKIKNEQ